MTRFNFLSLEVFAFILLTIIWLGFVYKKYIIKDSIDSSKAENNNFNNVITPAISELLKLEKVARNKGTGIELDSLLGLWKFKTVWKKQSDKEDSLTSLLLRQFSASLELIKLSKEENDLRLKILNSISFGILSIKFSGYGTLKGSQPVLPFFFQSIEFNIDKKVIFKKILLVPEDNQWPFFSLIGIGERGEWLSARGRGGGLAVWIK